MGIFSRITKQVPSTHIGTVRTLRRVGAFFIAISSSTALISHFLITYYPCSGPSMYPTMTSGLSYTIYSRRHRRGRNLQVGDIILYDNPIFLHQGACKRVIGMPGDFVLRDPSQSPTVGGAPVPGITDVDEKAVRSKRVREEPLMVQVPEGHVWCAGDSLSYSRDSRFYGPVPMALIKGKALYNGDGWFNWTSFRTPQLLPPARRDTVHLEPDNERPD